MGSGLKVGFANLRSVCKGQSEVESSLDFPGGLGVCKQTWEEGRLHAICEGIEGERLHAPLEVHVFDLNLSTASRRNRFQGTTQIHLETSTVKPLKERSAATCSDKNFLGDSLAFAR